MIVMYKWVELLVLNYHVELETDLLTVSSDSTGLDVYLTGKQIHKLKKELNSRGT